MKGGGGKGVGGKAEVKPYIKILHLVKFSEEMPVIAT